MKSASLFTMEILGTFDASSHKSRILQVQRLIEQRDIDARNSALAEAAELAEEHQSDAGRTIAAEIRGFLIT